VAAGGGFLLLHEHVDHYRAAGESMECEDEMVVAVGMMTVITYGIEEDMIGSARGGQHLRQSWADAGGGAGVGGEVQE
jgi:hypothetical protein